MTEKAKQAAFDELFSNFQLSPEVKKATKSRFDDLVAGKLNDQGSLPAETREHMQKLGEALPAGTVIQKTDVYYDRPYQEQAPA